MNIHFGGNLQTISSKQNNYGTIPSSCVSNFFSEHSPLSYINTKHSTFFYKKMQALTFYLRIKQMQEAKNQLLFKYLLNWRVVFI